MKPESRARLESPARPERRQAPPRPQSTPRPGAPPTPGSSEFWLVDATFSYRLPKRYGFLSVGVTNLFDEEFEYFEVDPANVTIQPARSIFARVTLAIP